MISTTDFWNMPWMKTDGKVERYKSCEVNKIYR